MSDIEEKQELSEVTKEGIVDNQEESQTETQTEEKKEDGFFKSTMNYISGKLKEKPETDESSDETKLVEDDIPDVFSEAAEAAGWDGATIIKHAKEGNNGKPFTDEELIEQIPHLQKQVETEEKTEKTEEKKEEKETTIPTNAKALEELIDKRVQEKLEGVSKEFDEAKQERQKQQAAADLKRVDELFDEASKTSAVFGLTKELPVFPAGERKGEPIPTSPQFKARDEVFTDALAFMNFYGSNIDDAMSKALNAYKGKNLEDDTRRSVVKDLKRHEKNLSGSRISKEVKKTYETEREADIDAIRQAQRAHGQDV